MASDPTYIATEVFSPNGAELTLILMLAVLEALTTKGVTWTWLDESKKT